jgi:hypothetical protein
LIHSSAAIGAAATGACNTEPRGQTHTPAMSAASANHIHFSACAMRIFTHNDKDNRREHLK